MSTIKFNGVDSITASFADLAQASDEDILAILRPAAERIQQAHIESIKSTFKQRTGALAASIKIEERRQGGKVFYRVLPKGKHPRENKHMRTPKRPPKQDSYTNAEIGFVLEHGSPRVPARHWMEKANEQVADEVNALLQEGWDKYIEAKGG